MILCVLELLKAYAEVPFMLAQLVTMDEQLIQGV